MVTLKSSLKRKASEHCDFLPEAKRRLQHAELNMRGVLIKQSARIQAVERTMKHLAGMQLLGGRKQKVLKHKIKLSEQKQAHKRMAFEQRFQLLEHNQAQSISDLQDKIQVLEQTIAYANTGYTALESKCQRLERKLARQTIVVTPRRSLDLHRTKVEAGTKKRTTAPGSLFSSRRSNNDEQSPSPDEMQLDPVASLPSPVSATKESPYEWSIPHGVVESPSSPSSNGTNVTVLLVGQTTPPDEMQQDTAAFYLSPVSVTEQSSDEWGIPRDVASCPSSPSLNGTDTAFLSNMDDLSSLFSKLRASPKQEYVQQQDSTKPQHQQVPTIPKQQKCGSNSQSHFPNAGSITMATPISKNGVSQAATTMTTPSNLLSNASHHNTTPMLPPSLPNNGSSQLATPMPQLSLQNNGLPQRATLATTPSLTDTGSCQTAALITPLVLSNAGSSRLANSMPPPALPDRNNGPSSMAAFVPPPALPKSNSGSSQTTTSMPPPAFPHNVPRGRAPQWLRRIMGEAKARFRRMRTRPVPQVSTPVNLPGKKRKSIDEIMPLMKKVRTCSRQIITPSAVTGVPASSVPLTPAEPSPFATFTVSSSKPKQLPLGACTPSQPSSPSSSILDLARTADAPMMFSPATMPDDQTIMTSALEGAYKLQPAMAAMAIQPYTQNSDQLPRSSDDRLRGAADEQLRKANDGDAAKPKGHEDEPASLRADNGVNPCVDESMTVAAENPDEIKVPNEHSYHREETTGQYEQTDDTAINAIKNAMNDQDLGADDESRWGRAIQRQSSEMQRSKTHSPRAVVGPEEQEDDHDECDRRDQNGQTWRGRGKKAMRSEPDDHHLMRSIEDTSDRSWAQTSAEQEPPLDPNNSDATNGSGEDSDDGSDDDMHDDIPGRQARAPRRLEAPETLERSASMQQRPSGSVMLQTRRNLDLEVEAEDYEDWKEFK